GHEGMHPRPCTTRRLKQREVRKKEEPMSRKYRSTTMAHALVVGLALVALALAAPGAAQAACQASGSIQVFPAASSCAAGVESGETFDITYQFTNTSSTIPLPGTDVSATLKGTTLAKLSCGDSACSAELTDSVFMPIGATGCVSQDPGVLNCTSAG